ncbi:hypothetical protein AGMMS50262_14620 [Bacteroidia bacterium]|nr:hypothetical protein AGMMS50262_14620 [Bacteroidia bacterium]
MKTIYNLFIFGLFVFTATNLAAQEGYLPFADSYDDYHSFYENENPFSYDTQMDWRVAYNQDFFSTRNELFSDFILRKGDWLSMVAPLPAEINPGGRPGDSGAYGAIGHDPIGDGTVCLLLIAGIYLLTVFWGLRVKPAMTK